MKFKKFYVFADEMLHMFDTVAALREAMIPNLHNALYVNYCSLSASDRLELDLYLAEYALALKRPISYDLPRSVH